MVVSKIALWTAVLLISAAALAQTAVLDPALLTKANAGDAVAQVAVGERCATGSGAERSKRQIAEDYRQAAAWYRKAAEQGNLAGQMHLAALYRDGLGVARDMAQAVQWYRQAAEQNDVTAQGILGVLYSFGQGVAQNYVEAYFWLDLAASEPSPEQAHYAANRQMVGTHITAEELEAIQDRIAQWKAAHPRKPAAPSQ
jgi:TPR repeat protein